MVLGDVADDLQTVAVRQAHIGQAQLEASLVERCPRLGHRTDASRRQPHAGQRQVDQLANIRLVVDDENPAQFAARAPLNSGN